MVTNIKAVNLILTPSINDYIENKLIKQISKLIEKDTENAIAEIEVSKTTRHHHSSEVIFRAEINLSVSKMTLRAEAQSSNLFAAIDEVKDEIVRELTTKKKRHIVLLKKGGQEIKRMLKGFKR